MSFQRIRTALTATDAVFAVIRVLVLFGSLIWIAYHPSTPKEKEVFSLIAISFFIYLLVLYFFIFVYPEKIRKIYLGALFFESGFLFFLISRTGGINSSFAFGFYLIAAVYSFYYGLLPAIAIAFFSSTLYMLSCPSCWAKIHWTDLALRVIFLFMIAITLGVLSERERRIHKKLVHAERLAAIGRMSSEVAHEIKNPLSSISLNVELLADEFKKYPKVDTREGRSLIDSIMSEVDRLGGVADEYLQFVRQPSLELKKGDINGLIESLMKFLEKEATHKKILFIKMFDGKLPQAMIDERQFRQALLNIFRNSFDALPNGGEISVATKRSGNHIEILIKDTGVGIPKEHIRRIFEPFFSTKDVGTGLGLSIAKDIINEHNGEITCESIKGKATIFTIRLPIYH